MIEELVSVALTRRSVGELEISKHLAELTELIRIIVEKKEEINNVLHLRENQDHEWIELNSCNEYDEMTNEQLTINLNNLTQKQSLLVSTSQWKLSELTKPKLKPILKPYAQIQIGTAHARVINQNLI